MDRGAKLSSPLAGQAVVITGGGGHLGSIMALGLAEEGVDVVIMGRTKDTLEQVGAKAAGFEGRIEYLVGDVGDDRVLDGAIAIAVRKGRRLAGWVNNAYTGSASQLADLQRESVEETLQGCLANVMMATATAGNYMRAHGGGSIVNVASMYGMVSPDPRLYAEHPAFHNPPAYGASKAGIIQYTRYCAIHWARESVRVNALSPGPFPSTAVQEKSSFVSALEDRVPMGRIGQPEELCGPLLFLLGPSSSYVTGHNLVVDGGWTQW